MICVSPTPSGVIYRKLLAQQFGWVRAGAAGVQRRVLKQPYKLLRAGVAYRCLPCFHPRNGMGIRRDAFCYFPINIVTQMHAAPFSTAQAPCHRICLSLRARHAGRNYAKEA